MRPDRIAAAAITAILAMAALTACVDEPPPATEPTPEATTATPTPTPSPTPSPTPTATPFAIECDTLVPPDALTGLFADFQRVPTYTPPAGSLGAQVLAAEGTVCGWQNAQNQTLMVAVAQLDDATLLNLKNDLVLSSRSVPTFRVEGYFQVAGGVGEAQAFLDPYWIVSTSVRYVEPGEAQPVIAAALAALQ